MRCPTCGKRVQQQMSECPNCGAMVPRSEAGSAKTATSTAPAGSDWKSVLRPHTTAPPPPTEGPFRRQTPLPAPPAREIEEDEEAPAEAPQAPAWTQYIVPGLIFLWLAFRMFGPDIKRFLTGEKPDERPAVTAPAAPLSLRSVTLCDRVDAGQPVNPRTRFSKSKDQLLTVYTAWDGSAAGQRVQFNWRPPSGKPLSGTVKIQPARQAGLPLVISGELMLGEFSATGPWRVDVVVGGKIVGGGDFVVEP